MNEHLSTTTALPLSLLKGAPAEARKWVRYPCDIEARCWPITHPPSPELLAVRLVDASAVGLGLLVDRDLSIGTFLTVEVPDPAGESSSTVLARVVRAVRRDDGRFLIGCVLAGKGVRVSQASSMEFDIPTLTAEHGCREAPVALTREAVDFVRQEIHQQMEHVSDAREAFLVEQRAAEESIRRQRHELERQAERLAARRAELDELNTRIAEEREQALPERTEVYACRQVSTESDTALMPSLQEQLREVEEERDAAQTEIRELRAQITALNRQETNLQTREMELQREHEAMTQKERELQLVEAEMRESVEIAERENHRLRLELNEERLYLARQREALRLERQSFGLETKHLRSPTPAPCTCRNDSAEAEMGVLRG